MKEKIVYQNGSVSLIEKQTKRGPRVVLTMGMEAVLIVPQLADGAYVLVEQVRPGKHEAVCEFPSGGVEKGESPEEAAIRELKEEVGASGTLRFVTTAEPLSGVVDFKVHIFVAEVQRMADTDKQPDMFEELSTVILSHDELLQKVRSAEVVDGYTLLGLAALGM